MDVRRSLLTATVLLLLSACGSGESGEALVVEEPIASTTTSTAAPAPAPTSSTTTAEAITTTTEPATTTTTEPRCVASPLEDSLGASTGDGQALPAGCYSVQRWGHELAMEIPEPGVTYFEFPYSVGVGAEETARSIVLMAQFTGVIPSEEVGTHPPHDDPIGEHMVDIPADLSTWIEAAPQIVVTRSGEYSIDGDAATWWDLQIDSSAGDTFACPFGACVATLVPSPPDERGTNFVMGDSARFRIVQLSGAGAGLFMWLQAPPEDFDETAALADSIVETLRIDG